MNRLTDLGMNTQPMRFLEFFEGIYMEYLGLDELDCRAAHAVHLRAAPYLNDGGRGFTNNPGGVRHDTGRERGFCLSLASYAGFGGDHDTARIYRWACFEHRSSDSLAIVEWTSPAFNKSLITNTDMAEESLAACGLEPGTPWFYPVDSHRVDRDPEKLPNIQAKSFKHGEFGKAASWLQNRMEKALKDRGVLPEPKKEED